MFDDTSNAPATGHPPPQQYGQNPGKYMLILVCRFAYMYNIFAQDSDTVGYYGLTLRYEKLANFLGFIEIWRKPEGYLDFISQIKCRLVSGDMTSTSCRIV